MELKDGCVVQLKNWDEMVEEYGLIDVAVHIKNDMTNFLPEMKYLINNYIRLEQYDDDNMFYKDGYVITEGMVKEIISYKREKNFENEDIEDIEDIEDTIDSLGIVAIETTVYKVDGEIFDSKYEAVRDLLRKELFNIVDSEVDITGEEIKGIVNGIVHNRVVVTKLFNALDEATESEEDND